MTLPAESDLRNALRPVRPDADEFEHAFQRKLAERRAVEARQQEEEPRWRAAAGFVPIGLFAPKAVTAPAIALAKKAGAKSVAGFLALPAVSIAMGGLTGFRELWLPGPPFPG